MNKSIFIIFLTTKIETKNYERKFFLTHSMTWRSDLSQLNPHKYVPLQWGSDLSKTSHHKSSITYHATLPTCM